MSGFRRGYAGVALFSALSFWTSCALVREDRRPCPCALSVQLTALPAYPVSLLLGGVQVGYALRDTTLVVPLEKEAAATLVAFSGAVAETRDGAPYVRIPQGFEAPPLHAFSAVVNPHGEQAHLRVQMRRDFCTLSLHFSGPPGWGEPCRVEVCSLTDGLALETGEPTAGPFRCTLEGDFSCRLPRQGDPLHLRLEITMPEGVVRSFPLGACLREAGYDWHAPVLEDIALELDCSVTEIHFRLSGWPDAQTWEIRI